jgi:N-acyl homoserine lactone hydrolase
MAVKKVFVLDGGTLPMPHEWLTYSVGKERGLYPSAIYQVYCETTEGKVLIETGFRPDGPIAKLLSPAKQTEDQLIANQLAKIGVKPSEIDIVINTHLHGDHCGNNALFKNATFIVQRAEMRYAYAPMPHLGEMGYCRGDFDHPDLNYELIDGDKQIVEGIETLLTPGHTPGLQAVIITTAKGNVYILPFDALIIREQVTKPWIGPWDGPYVCMGYLYNLEDSYKSIYRIMDIAKTRKGEIWFGHDRQFFDQARKPPEYYE